MCQAPGCDRERSGANTPVGGETHEPRDDMSGGCRSWGEGGWAEGWGLPEVGQSQAGMVMPAKILGDERATPAGFPRRAVSCVWRLMGRAPERRRYRPAGQGLERPPGSSHISHQTLVRAGKTGSVGAAAAGERLSPRTELRSEWSHSWGFMARREVRAHGWDLAGRGG